jgi:PDZ domain-containing protein
MPLAVLLPVLTLVLIAFNLTVPYVALGPGPTFDTLGDVDDKPVIEIEGVETDETTGSLVMTTVGVTDNLNLAQTVTAWLSGRYGLAPREQVYPPNRSKDEVRAVDQAQFAQSERSAELAALHGLGVGDGGCPLAGRLRNGRCRAAQHLRIGRRHRPGLTEQ